MCEIDWTATAAWVQAIGSIGAIIAAFMIGRSQSRDTWRIYQEQRESDQAEVLRRRELGATWLALMVFNAKSRADMKVQMISSLNFSDPGGRMGPEEVEVFRWTVAAFEEKWALHDSNVLSQIPELDSEAAEKVMLVVECTRRYDSRIHDLLAVSQSRQFTAATIKLASDRCLETASLISTNCQKAIDEISKHHHVLAAHKPDTPQPSQ